MKEGFSDQENEMFQKLSKEKMPSSDLEQRLIEHLRSEQLLKKINFNMNSYWKLTTLLATLALTFFIGNYLFKQLGNGFSDCPSCTCEDMPGFDQVNNAGKVVLLGELHGTKEAPGFVQNLVCNALKEKLPVTVFLELPQSEQEQVDEFLRSDGELEAKRKFLQTYTWSRDYQDGRNSEAIFALIDHLREIISEGAPIKLELMDNPSAPDREAAMANHVLKTIGQDTERFYTVLVGNYHNRIIKTTGAMGYRILTTLGAERVISLNQLYGPGTAWVCLASEGCGAHQLGGRDGETRGITIDKDTGGGTYHGTYGVGAIHASFPAKDMKLEDE